jgi:hypothetical protein
VIVSSLPFRHPSVLPPRRGLYVRDWRGTDVLPASDRALSIDLWEPSDDPMLAPGCWYVSPGWNDASEQRLPWREATREELLMSPILCGGET